MAFFRKLNISHFLSDCGMQNLENTAGQIA
jgi:hypothetical protein